MKKMKLVVPAGCTEFVVEIAEDTDEEGAFNNLGSVTLHEMKGGTNILAEIKWTKYEYYSDFFSVHFSALPFWDYRQEIYYSHVN
jgi:hypothetical protein